MENERGTSRRDDYSALPGEHVTIDQVVAANVRYWRRAAGMTQAELGERLGWTKAAVSAAEGSARPGRDRRQFTAQLLAELAAALGVPVSAFLLPPPDDGVSVRYLMTAGGVTEGMAALVNLLLPLGDDSPLAAPWRERVALTASRYLDPDRGLDPWDWDYLPDMVTSRQRRDRLARIAAQRVALAGLMDDLDQAAEVIAGEDAALGGDDE